MFGSRAVRAGGVAAALLTCALSLGCGGDKTHRVSGTVTFKGQPIPAGKIYFLPDSTKGNSGPAGYADIKNGKYDTSDGNGRGSVAGAVLISIEGIDPDAKPAKVEKGDTEALVKSLFPRYEIQADMPSSSSTKDIDVPASAETQKAKPEGKKIINP
ncbi:MAG TPA: hypothetical protein VGE74_13595 [Gemmata sp.]